MARAAWRDPAPRVTLVLSRTVEKVDRVGGTQVDPVLERKVVEGEQHVEVEEDLHETIVDILRAERADRRTVSVFTHTNVATAALSDALTDAGLPHEQVGMAGPMPKF